MYKHSTQERAGMPWDFFASQKRTSYKMPCQLSHYIIHFLEGWFRKRGLKREREGEIGAFWPVRLCVYASFIQKCITPEGCFYKTINFHNTANTDLEYHTFLHDKNFIFDIGWSRSFPLTLVDLKHPRSVEKCENVLIFCGLRRAVL